MLYRITEAVRDERVSDLGMYTDWHRNSRFLTLPAGREHYRLLAHLAMQTPPGSTIVDIGTYLGMSAAALSKNESLHVVTYNLQDDIPDDVLSIKHKKNISTVIGDCLSDKEVLMRAPLIVLDTNHTGDFERKCIETLVDWGYRGIVVCDDIALNDAMKVFWQWVPLQKIDLTHVGHWSGTGAIVFDPDHVNLVVDNLSSAPSTTA